MLKTGPWSQRWTYVAEKNCFINSCKTVDEERDGREEDVTKFDPTPNTDEQQ